jgi:hypothetical protein
MESSYNAFSSQAPAISVDSNLEDLGLSGRTHLVLKRCGCFTVNDVLRLNLNKPVPGLGRKGKEELLTKLQSVGFSHSAEAAASEITQIERTLERIEDRLEKSLGAAVKEIRKAKEGIRKLKGATYQSGPRAL